MHSARAGLWRGADPIGRRSGRSGRALRSRHDRAHRAGRERGRRPHEHPVRRQRALPDCAARCTTSRICPARSSCGRGNLTWKAAPMSSGSAASSIGMCTSWQKWPTASWMLSLPDEPAALANIAASVLQVELEREAASAHHAVDQRHADRGGRFVAARIARLANCAGQPPVVSRRNLFLLPELMDRSAAFETAGFSGTMRRLCPRLLR